jgi:hypothetical protein
MVEAGVDAVGIHPQSDARHANPKLIEEDYLGDVVRAVFERIGKTALVQVVGGLSIAQAKSLAKAGLRCFVISGNMGLPDGNARYNLPPAEIQRLVADFIAEVSGGLATARSVRRCRDRIDSRLGDLRCLPPCWDASVANTANGSAQPAPPTALRNAGQLDSGCHRSAGETFGSGLDRFL